MLCPRIDHGWDAFLLRGAGNSKGNGSGIADK